MYRLNKPYRPNNRVWRGLKGWWVIPIGIALVVALEVWVFLNIVNWGVYIGMKLFGGSQ